MKHLLLLPIALFAFSAHAVTYNDNYGYDYSGSDQYNVAAQNAELREENETLKQQVKDASTHTQNLMADLAEANDDLAHCNWGNFVALQQLDIRTAERDTLETANEELQDDLADILALANHYDINDPSAMATILESIQTIAGGD